MLDPKICHAKSCFLKPSINTTYSHQCSIVYLLGKLDLDYHGNGSRTVYIFDLLIEPCSDLLQYVDA